MPTLVEIGGGKVPADIDVKSLLPLPENPNADWPERHLFFHIGRWSNKGGPDKAKYDKAQGFAVRNTRYRLVNNEELYDIQADPGETTNLYSRHPDIVRSMGQAHDQWRDGVRPFMVSENADRAGLDSYRKACEEQMKKGELPEWEPPDASKK